MLEKYAKTQSLRVYLFSFSQFYDNVSIDWITENFEMSSSEVQSTVSKLMINEELKASWDEPSRSLVLHKTEPTRLQVIIDFRESNFERFFQNLALQLASRLNQLTESNERLCESKQGSNFTAFYQSNRMRGKFRNLNQLVQVYPLQIGHETTTVGFESNLSQPKRSRAVQKQASSEPDPVKQPESPSALDKSVSLTVPVQNPCNHRNSGTPLNEECISFPFLHVTKNLPFLKARLRGHAEILVNRKG